MANTNKPGASRPASSSASNLAAMQQAQAAQQAAAQRIAQHIAAAQQAAAAGGVRPGQQPTYSPAQVQQYVLMQQQAQAQAHAAAGGRAPSPGAAAGAGGAGQYAVVVSLRSADGKTSSLTTVPLPPDFVAAQREFVTQNINLPNMHPYIYQAYSAWVNEREQQRRQALMAGAPMAGGAPAAKRAKSDTGSGAVGPVGVRPGMPTSAAMLQHQQMMASMVAQGARPPLPPGAGMPPGMTAAQAAQAAQMRLQQNLQQRRTLFPPIVRPSNEEERQMVPRTRLQALVKQVGMGMSIQNAKASEDAEDALRAVAEDFVSGAASFAAAMARRRKSDEIEPADLLHYLERTWNIQVPGFSSGEVKPYRRNQPASADHQRRMAAVRKAMAAAAAAVGGGEEGGGGGAQQQQQQQQAGSGAAAAAAGAGKEGGEGSPGERPAGDGAKKGAPDLAHPHSILKSARCGMCENCLNPQRKKACIVARQQMLQQTGGTTSAASQRRSTPASVAAHATAPARAAPAAGAAAAEDPSATPAGKGASEGQGGGDSPPAQQQQQQQQQQGGVREEAGGGSDANGDDDDMPDMDGAPNGKKA